MMADLHARIAWPAGVEEDVALAPCTSWRVGGPARYHAQPASLPELSVLLREAKAHALPVYLLGGGCNLLVDDAGVPGLVLALRGEAFTRIEIDKARIVAGAGVPLPRVLQEAARAGLAGLEDLAGIPGTLGGAVRMNAGGRDEGIGARVAEVTALDENGETVRLHGDALRFGYRASNLSPYRVVAVELALETDEPAAIQARLAAARERKRAAQPIDGRSAGCVFRNPPRGPGAGELIDAAGLKGRAVGDAVVSDRHANFILNRGRATAAAILRLVDEIRREVERVHGVTLDLEVEQWPRTS